jgi:hypothetical protein
MIDTSQLSDELIKGQLEAYLSYGRGARPVPPGIYCVRILEILEVRSESGFGTFQMDLVAVGEARWYRSRKSDPLFAE